MLILGINGGLNTAKTKVVPDLNMGVCHDASASLISDGKVIAAFEEERFTRIKHTNYFPQLSVLKCLEIAGLEPENIDCVAFSADESQLNAQAQELTAGKFTDGRSFLQHVLHQHTGLHFDTSRMRFYHHHLAHAASAYFQSGFADSLVATFDGAGDGISGALYDCSNNDLKLLRTIGLEDSLGYYYLEVTRFLGFELFDEYKVMGLAPYGDASHLRAVFEKMFSLCANGVYQISKDFMDHLHSIHKPRLMGTPITQLHMDAAASLQESLECILLHVLDHFRLITGHERLCLAGGVALNGTFTGNLIYKGVFKDVFVNPASGDNGLSLGSALACYYTCKQDQRPTRLQTLFWGSDCPRHEPLGQDLKLWNGFIDFEPLSNASETAAHLIAQNKVIGWFQGRSEFGPRALGNRSILADPRPFENKSRVNSKIKLREEFRPFAPSILEEYLEDFFHLPCLEFKHSPFMTFVLKVKKNYQSILGAVTHVDGSARLQTISKDQNVKYWWLIEYFRQLTGIPVVLNTSFNNNEEPIVDSPHDAVACFLTNQLDYLIIGDYLVTRKPTWTSSNTRAKILLPDRMRAIAMGDESFALWDTYFEKATAITVQLHELLSDGGYLPENAGGQFQQEITRLWEKRVIRILPHEVESVNG